MNCIFLLLLLSCCGGFGCGGSRSGSNCVGNIPYTDNNGRSCDGTSPLSNGNNIGNTFPTLGSGCGYQDAMPLSGNDGDCGCGDNDQGIRDISGNPSNWQDYPEISHRDNCDCDS